MKQVLVSSSVLILALAGLRPLLRGRIRPRVQYCSSPCGCCCR